MRRNFLFGVAIGVLLTVLWFAAAGKKATDSEADLHARLGFLLYEQGQDDAALEALLNAKRLGSNLELVEFTIAALGTRLDADGPFPRFLADAKTPAASSRAVADEARRQDRQSPPRRQGHRNAGSAGLGEYDEGADDDDTERHALRGEGSTKERRPREPAMHEQGSEASEQPFTGQQPEANGDPDDDQQENDHQENESLDDEPFEGDQGPAIEEEEEEDEEEEDEEEEEESAHDREHRRLLAADAQRCSIPLQRRGRSGTFIAIVELGGVDAPLVFDTGATLTVITRELAERAGLEEDTDATIVARTANGTTRFSTTLIDELVIGDLVATDIRAAICDDCGARGMAGLLGLDVQRQLSLSLDVATGVARYPCEQE